MFTNKPTLPIAFMLHERKLQICHEQFISILREKMPKLGQRAVTVITDRETGIINAFEQQLENCNLLICWNHILNDITFW